MVGQPMVSDIVMMYRYDEVVEGNAKGDVLLLNFGEYCNNKLFSKTWSNAGGIKMCADGGANRLYDSGIFDGKNYAKPDYICGDLDSIRDDVRNYYDKLGSMIVSSDCENTNDFQKSLFVICDESISNVIYKDSTSKFRLNCGCDSCILRNSRQKPLLKKDTEHVVIVFGFGGRFDHTLQNVSSCFPFLNYRRIIIIGDENLVEILPACPEGITLVRHSSMFSSVGFVPLFGPAIVSSSGLKWDMQDTKLEFGSFISTSNEFLGDSVTIYSTNYLVFTAQYSSLHL